MKQNNEIIFIKGLEKKFSIFRWVLLILITPITFRLSDYSGNVKYLIIALATACIYTTFVTIAAYSKGNRFQSVLMYTMYFDIPFISLLLCIRGGLRSDLFFIYFLVISYDGAKFGFRGTIISLLQSVVFFSIASFYFTPPESFELSRYFIRVIYLILITAIMYEINYQIDQSRIKEKAAKELAYKDPLTGLSNRLELPERYEELKQAYEETGQTFAIVLFDLDNFKLLNDKKGHAFGDEVLVSISKILKNNISIDDFVCRFGGEEFLLFFAKSNEQSAYIKANKIRENLASHTSLDEPITVSVGINMFQEGYTMIENISFADEAMYAAKNAGKNQVMVYQNMSMCRKLEKLSG